MRLPHRHHTLPELTRVLSFNTPRVADSYIHAVLSVLLCPTASFLLEAREDGSAWRAGASGTGGDFTFLNRALLHLFDHAVPCKSVQAFWY
jgi:hypothetical protein